MPEIEDEALSDSDNEVDEFESVKDEKDANKSSINGDTSSASLQSKLQTIGADELKSSASSANFLSIPKQSSSLLTSSANSSSSPAIAIGVNKGSLTKKNKKAPKYNDNDDDNDDGYRKNYTSGKASNFDYYDDDDDYDF